MHLQWLRPQRFNKCGILIVGNATKHNKPLFTENKVTCCGNIINYARHILFKGFIQATVIFWIWNLLYMHTYVYNIYVFDVYMLYIYGWESEFEESEYY